MPDNPKFNSRLRKLTWLTLGLQAVVACAGNGGGGGGTGGAGLSGAGSVAGQPGAGAAGQSGAGAAGGTGGASGNSGASGTGGAGGERMITGANTIRLNDACLGATLPPPLASGLQACRILLSGVSGDCGQPGLSSATAPDVDAVTAAAAKIGETVVNQPVCELGQQTTSGTACMNNSVWGWCLVQGSCPKDGGRNCAQSICNTSALTGLPPGYQLPAWIVCD
jgi:hypothetical protein